MLLNLGVKFNEGLLLWTRSPAVTHFVIQKISYINILLISRMAVN